MNQNGDAGPSNVILDEAHILAAQPRRKQILDGETGRAELSGCEHETEGEDDVSQSKRQLWALHTTAKVRVYLRCLTSSYVFFFDAVFIPFSNTEFSNTAPYRL